jgi:hypothetical protein
MDGGGLVARESWVHVHCATVHAVDLAILTSAFNLGESHFQ